MTNRLTRREVVKNLGKLGAVSAVAMSPLSSLAFAPPPCRPFSIVLHGLFLLDVFSVDENYIRISTPNVAGHCYLAGPWSPHIADYTNVCGYHDEPLWDSHIQTLPSTGGMPILLPKAGDPDHGKAYLSFAVPYPTTIRALRSFDASEVDYPGDYIKASKFPLVLALEYDYLPTSFPPIKGTSLDRNRNYHVFAESPVDMECSDAIQHGMYAIRKLWEMLPNPPSSIPLPKDKNKRKKEIDASGWPCNNRAEEGGLSELPYLKDNPFKSVHLPLCANFIVL
jgi:hypothetical protein